MLVKNKFKDLLGVCALKRFAKHQTQTVLIFILVGKLSYNIRASFSCRERLLPYGENLSTPSHLVQLTNILIHNILN